jgi:[ribosomal protein S5]-alanine N-acetyltransferase
MMKVPSFETSRLYLRPISLSDAPAYERYFVDYEVVKHLSSLVPWPYPPGGVTAFLSELILPAQGRGRWTWGIFLKEQPHELVGCVDIWLEGRPENRGFWLGKTLWGKGLMTEALEPVTRYAFDTLGFEKFVFANAVGNLRSRRIKEKTGARLVRVVPAKFVSPQYTEQEIWELSRADWDALNQM